MKRSIWELLDFSNSLARYEVSEGDWTKGWCKWFWRKSKALKYYQGEIDKGNWIFYSLCDLLKGKKLFEFVYREKADNAE